MTSAAASDSGDTPPTRLGRYELVHELGHGGMAHVYLARTSGPAGFQKWFAIKRIYERMAKDREFVDMFLDEARLAAALQHPNVVQTFELGHEDDQYFIAMEYLHGEPLSAVARRHQDQRGPLDPALAAFVCAQAAEGLHHAHEARDRDNQPLQLVHRDVSPHNIFVTYEGRVVLTDFGVAKARGRVTQTETGMVKGKIAYSAPEQLRGESVDRRVDVFALGVVLFELTTGRRLFKGASDAETLQRIYSGHRVAPSSLVADYPPQLESILERALAHDADERTPTALEFARELRAYLAGRGVDASQLERRMSALFEDEITEKSAILRRAGTSDPGTSDPAASDPGTPDPAAPHARAEAPMEEEPSRSHTRATQPPPEAPKRRWALLAALGAMLVLAAAWALGTRSSSGVVRIDSDPPGAQAFVDGRPRGTTPALLEAIPEGPHEVRLEREGYEPFRARFRLSGDRVELRYAMRTQASAEAGDTPEAMTGAGDEATEDPAASDDTSVDGAAAERPVDGAAAQQGHGSAAGLAGDTSEAVSAPLASPVLASPVLASPVLASPVRRPRPAPTTGHLSLVTDPWARVWVNGRDAGYTPLVGFEVPAGRLRVRLQPRGEGAFVSRVYRVAAGEAIRHRESL